MSKCVYCQARKGKRFCPALNGLICSQCCGESRLVRIACPPECPYLDANTAYQQKRAGERFAHDRREFYRSLFERGGEPAAALFNLIEVAAYGYFRHRRDGQDAEVLAAIQTLRRTLSPLHIPASPPGPFAASLKTEYEAFVGQGERHHDARVSPVDQETATAVLEQATAFITQVSGGGLQSSRFLTALIGFIDLYHPDVASLVGEREHEPGRIIVPGSALPSGLPSPRGPGALHAPPGQGT